MILPMLFSRKEDELYVTCRDMVNVKVYIFDKEISLKLAEKMAEERFVDYVRGIKRKRCAFKYCKEYEK